MSEIDPNDYEMEAIKRAAKEREEIVKRYEKGENHDGDTDRWEDSAFAVYKVTDRYGFLHEKELPEIPSLEEDKRKQLEVKRQYKWLKMINKWPSVVNTEKLRTRVYKGIPLNLRGDSWRLMLNVADLMKEKPKTYEEMKERSLKHSSDIKQIDMDVNRTYRNHIMFRKRYSIKQQQLFFVLSAYSMYNTEVGYCQGMSQIAALLLMYMSEEEAFWALHSLLYGKKHRMHGFFIPGFPKLLRFQDHHDKILKKFVPRLKKHLDKNEIFASLYTMKWFFQCFLDRAPFPLTLRLWDVYVLDGERVLVAMSYATLKMHKTQIKKMDMDGIVTFLQERLADNFGNDDDVVIDQLKSSMLELKKAKLDLPPDPGDDEMAKVPFGVPVKPTFAQETGIRVPVNEKTNSIKKSIQKDLKPKEANGNVSEHREKTSETNAAVVGIASNRGHDASASRRNSSRRKKLRESDKDRNIESRTSRRGSSRKSQNLDESRDRRISVEKQRQISSSSAHERPRSKDTGSDDKPRDSESNHLSHEHSETVLDGGQKRRSREIAPSAGQPLNKGNSEKTKIVWKSPSNVHPKSSQNQPPSPRHRTTQVSRAQRSNSHRKNEDFLADGRTSTSPQVPPMKQANTDSTLRLDTPSSIPTVNVLSPSTSDHSRPFSIYDNVGSVTESEPIAGSMTESEQEVTNAHSLQHDTSTTSGLIYQSKMEESLESLRELVASLPVSPSSPAPSPFPGGSRPLHSHRYKSFEVLDDELADESNLSSLDEVARNLSRSMELLEQDQRNVEERSAFRKAVEGAGIMQLPKRPSSTALSAALSSIPDETPTDVVSTSHQPGMERLGSINYVQYNTDRRKQSGQWNESDLNLASTPSYKLKSDVESHPIRVNLSAIYRNENNNNRSVAPIDGQRSLSKPKKNNLTYYSRHGLSDITESDPKESQSFDTFMSPSYPSRDYFNVPNDPSYVSSVNSRVHIRPKAPAAAPPSYVSSASQLRYFNPELHSSFHARSRDSGRSRTRRKNSATTAVQTEPSHAYGGSSLV